MGSGDRLQAVCEATRAFALCARDYPRLLASIPQEIAAVLDAACELHLLDDAGAARPATADADVIELAVRVDDRPVGVLRIAPSPSRGRPFDAEDRAVAELLVDHAAVVIGNARAYREIRELRAAAEAAHAALRTKLGRFAHLAETGIIGVLVSGADRRVIEVNDALAAMLGYTTEELLAEGFSWFALTPPECRLADLLAVEQLRTLGFAALREKAYIRKDGQRIAVIVGSAMIEGGGASEVLSFVLDVTQHKRVEAEAARLRVERAGNARFAALVNSSDDAIIGKTLDGVITSWNQGARKMFGYTAEEVVGKPVAILIPPGLEHEEELLLAHLRNGEVTHLDTSRRRKNGELVEVSVTSSPVYDAAGMLIGASKVARDVTQRRRAEEELARAKDRAEAASRELEAFSYSVAHDLRAPLRAINGFANILLGTHAATLDADGRDCLDEIRHGADRMAGLIDGLLSLSRVTRTEPRREPVDLAALVHGGGRARHRRAGAARRGHHASW